MKVLAGRGYAVARLVGVKAEMWAEVTGKEPPITDTQFAQGCVVTNSITDETGLLIDENIEYFDKLPEPHMSRLADVVEGDGWMDTCKNT
jgi:hypothetical protein